jgi:hypothetical protein
MITLKPKVIYHCEIIEIFLLQPWRDVLESLPMIYSRLERIVFATAAPPDSPRTPPLRTEAAT